MLAKGGSLQIAILIKGFEVWGPWRQYIANNPQAFQMASNAAAALGT